MKYQMSQRVVSVKPSSLNHHGFTGDFFVACVGLLMCSEPQRGPIKGIFLGWRLSLCKAT